MFGNRFFGLRGTKLQIAVGVLAGLDFLLFGYDQGVTGGLLTIPSFYKQFPEIDAASGAYKALPTSQKNHRTTIQGEIMTNCDEDCERRKNLTALDRRDFRRRL